MKLFFLQVCGASDPGTSRNVTLFAIVAEQPVEVVEMADQQGLALFGGRIRPPGVDQRMGLTVVLAAVHTAVERDEQQCPRLFGPHGRQHLLDGLELDLLLRCFAEDRVGLQQQGVEFAAEYVARERQVLELLLNLRGDGLILRGSLAGPMAAQRFMKPLEEPAVVQSGVVARIFAVQLDDFVLSGLDLQQRDAHPVVDRDQNLLVARRSRCDDPGLDTCEAPFGDADPVALDQPGRVGRADRHGCGIRAGDPLQIAHGAVREIGVVICLLVVLDARQKIVLRKALLDPVDLAFGGMHEQIVVQQRAPGFDKTAVYLSGLDEGRSKVFEKRLSVTLPPSQFAIQLFGHGPSARGVYHHVPAYRVAILERRILGQSVRGINGWDGPECHKHGFIIGKSAPRPRRIIVNYTTIRWLYVLRCVIFKKIIQLYARLF